MGERMLGAVWRGNDCVRAAGMSDGLVKSVCGGSGWRARAGGVCLSTRGGVARSGMRTHGRGGRSVFSAGDGRVSGEGVEEGAIGAGSRSAMLRVAGKRS